MLAGGRLPGVLRHPDPPLSDGVISLRAMTAKDADALTAACQDPEIARWTRVPVPYRRADALSWIAASELELDAGVTIGWLAVDADDRVLASISVMQIDRRAATGEIGYWVAPEARGRGVATRAVRLGGHPEQFAGGRIERDDGAARSGGGIESAAGHQRRAFQFELGTRSRGYRS